MDSLKLIFLSSCLVCTVFTIIMIAKYPQYFWEDLCFKNKSNCKDIFDSITVWVLFCGFVGTFIYFAILLQSIKPQTIY